MRIKNDNGLVHNFIILVTFCAVILLSIFAYTRISGNGLFAKAEATGQNYNPYYKRCSPEVSKRPTLAKVSSAEAKQLGNDLGNGTCVSALQRALNIAIKANIKEDNWFNTSTEVAVSRFQQLMNINESRGSVGPSTWLALDAKEKESYKGIGKYSGKSYLPHTSVWNGYRTLILGDSLTLGADLYGQLISKLENVGLVEVKIVRSSGKNMDWGTTQLKNLQKYGYVPTTIINALGTNNLQGSSTRDSHNLDMDEFFLVAGNDIRVVWVNSIVFDSGGEARSLLLNQALEDQIAKRDNMSIVDWAAFISSNKQFLSSDKVHYNSSGYIKRSDCMITALNKAKPKDILNCDGTINKIAPATPIFNSSGAKIVAVGDIACSPSSKDFNNGLGAPTKCKQADVAKAVNAENAESVLLLGDLQYESGTLSEFEKSFVPAWKVVTQKMYAITGNHEYASGNAKGYYQAMSKYFPNATIGEEQNGYYDFKAGEWDAYALNSNCSKIGGCNVGSRQYTWLADKLKKSTKKCSLAMWHHPTFTSGLHRGDGGEKLMKQIWALADNSGVDVVLAAHDHNYERFNLQNSEGKADPNGMRLFIVGNGGKDLRSINAKRTNNSQIAINEHFGYLVMYLRDNDYSWQLKNISGAVIDSGQTDCN